MIEVAWWFSDDGPTRGFDPWDEDETVLLRPGQALWARVAATNRDRSGHVFSNLVVPVELEALHRDPRTGAYEELVAGAENEVIVPEPPHAVRYHFAQRRWAPGVTWPNTYLIVVPGIVRSGDKVLLYEVTATDQLEVRTLRRLRVAE